MASERVDVLRLLNRLGIEYKPEGGELWARCPAHADAHPSWSINQTTGVHHCFSCGWGGGAAALVIQALGADELAWTARDAWEWIRAQGLLVGDQEAALDVELYLMHTAKKRFTLPVGVMLTPLTEWPSPAARYVCERGILDRQLRRWGIGYATGGRLAGRVVFPVHDASGKLLSYTARSFVGAEPRYLTPKGRDGADEAALFGERFWPGPGGRRRVVVVEGAIKALAVERAIGGHVAGVLGATQAGNTRVISKLATFDEVVILTDSDPAGDAAAETLFGALARHVVARRARLEGPAVDDASPQAIEDAVQP